MCVRVRVYSCVKVFVLVVKTTYSVNYKTEASRFMCIFIVFHVLPVFPVHISQFLSLKSLLTALPPPTSLSLSLSP